MNVRWPPPKIFVLLKCTVRCAKTGRTVGTSLYMHASVLRIKIKQGSVVDPDTMDPDTMDP